MLASAHAGHALDGHPLVRGLDRGCAAERMTAGQQLIGDAGQCIDVVARIGLLVEEHLGAGVGRRQRAERAGVEARAGRAIVALARQGAGDPEVEHLDLALTGDEDVAGLEVRVDHALLVGVGQRACAALDDRPGILESQALRVTLDEPIERLALEELHRHVDQRRVAIEVVDGHDVRVRERLRAARLALQRHQRLGATAELVVQELDRDIRIAVARLFLAQVARLEDDPHAALAQAPLEHEALLDDHALLDLLLDDPGAGLGRLVVPSGPRAARRSGRPAGARVRGMPGAARRCAEGGPGPERASPLARPCPSVTAAPFDRRRPAPADRDPTSRCRIRVAASPAAHRAALSSHVAGWSCARGPRPAGGPSPAGKDRNAARFARRARRSRAAARHRLRASAGSLRRLR